MARRKNTKTSSGNMNSRDLTFVPRPQWVGVVFSAIHSEEAKQRKDVGSAGCVRVCERRPGSDGVRIRLELFLRLLLLYGEMRW